MSEIPNVQGDVEKFRKLFATTIRAEAAKSPMLADLFEIAHNTLYEISSMMMCLDLEVPEVRELFRTHDRIKTPYYKRLNESVEKHLK